MRRVIPAASILLILLASFSLRLNNLSARSLWADEGFTIMRAQYHVAAMLQEVIVDDMNTPLHYLMLNAWMRFAGISEFAARLLSVFAGVITVALACQFTMFRDLGQSSGSVDRDREGVLCLKGPWQSGRAVVPALLVAVWPVCVSQSQELRMYGVLLCLIVLSVVVLMRCLRQPRAKHWASWGICCVAVFATHTVGAFAFAAESLIVVIWWLRQPHGSRPIAAVWSVVLTGGLLGASLAAMRFVSTYSVAYKANLDYATLVVASLAANVLPRSVPQYWILPAAVAALAVLTLTMVRGPARWHATIGLSLTNVLAVAAFCVFSGSFAGRYATGFAPVMTAAFGAALAAWRPIPRFTATVLTAGLCAIVLLAWNTDPVYANADYRSAATYIRQHIGSDETILLLSDSNAAVFQYYYGPTGWHLLQPPGATTFTPIDYESVMPILNRALTGKLGVWLLLWQDREADPGHVVQTLLRRQAHKLQAEGDTPAFTGLAVQHFRFDHGYETLPERVLTSDSAVQATDQRRGLNSLGCHQFRVPRTGDTLMEVLCFWQTRPYVDLSGDLSVSLRVNDTSGKRVVHVDQPITLYGMPDLPFEKIITSVYFIPIPPDLPVGRYSLEVIPYTPTEEISPHVTTPVTIVDR